MGETSSDSMSYSNRALALISSSKLPHPDSQIVRAFVVEAVDPELAAQYFLKTLGAFPELGDRESKDLELYRFLTDWTTLFTKCGSQWRAQSTPDFSCMMLMMYDISSSTYSM